MKAVSAAMSTRRAVESAIDGSKDHKSSWAELLRAQLADTSRYLTPPRKLPLDFGEKP